MMLPLTVVQRRHLAALVVLFGAVSASSCGGLAKQQDDRDAARTRAACASDGPFDDARVWVRLQADGSPHPDRVVYMVDVRHTPAGLECPWLPLQAPSAEVFRGMGRLFTAPVQQGRLTINIDDIDPAILWTHGPFWLQSASLQPNLAPSLNGEPILRLARIRAREKSAAEEKERRARELVLQRLEREKRAKAEAAQAEFEAMQREAEEQARLKRLRPVMRRLGMPTWKEKCHSISGLDPAACATLPTEFQRGECRRRQKLLIRRKPIFLLTNVPHVVNYDAARRRFSVVVLGILNDLVVLDECWRRTCEAFAVSTKKLKVKGGQAKYPRWMARYKSAIVALARPVARFTVPIAKVESPDSFERQLTVDALVRVVDRQDSMVGDWFDIRNARVKLVGLRAYLSDLSWGRTIKTPPRAALRHTCRLDESDQEFLGGLSP